MPDLSGRTAVVTGCTGWMPVKPGDYCRISPKLGARLEAGR
jgi:hypothetical protein